VIAALLAATTAACSGSSTPSPAPSPRPRPDLAAFLALPVATPSACTAANGQSVGRTSPWKGTVDVSVFLRDNVSPGQAAALGRKLRATALIQRVYFESHREAFHEFQRLYTCWASVPESSAPASYRLILIPGISIAARDRLVGRLAGLHVVDGVSCDASIQCLAVVGSATTPPSS